ncbi:nucleoside-diphosphate sugar epimerase/dehydratase [Microbacterium sp. AZCO]|uniref:polysaccharide biosynthesis protein n=1 Tax=Microbacterium sp. AZCO TaxID=3142976 RepID=UPI0031F36ABF
MNFDARTSRRAHAMLTDAGAWCIALTSVVVARYDFDLDSVRWLLFFLTLTATVAVQLGVGSLLNLYSGRHRTGTFAEAVPLFGTVAITGIVIGIPVTILGVSIGVPRSTFLFATPFALIIMAAARYVVRVIEERRMRPAATGERTLILGAGYLGSTLVRRMMTDRESAYYPVGLLDDSPSRKRVWIDGLKVLGTREDIGRVAEKTGATVLVVAIGRVDGEFLRDVTDRASAAGVQVKVFPSLDAILEGQSRLQDLRNISIEDLIGRQAVDMAVEDSARYIHGKRVLVTGAGGSIGAELCRQIAKLGPAELIMLDRDETGLQEAQLGTFGNGLLDTDDVVIASIRDRETLRELFRERRPEVVFHAAALKHLPTLQRYPLEAWKTNVLGTQNVLDAALEVDVECFVNISTDKAANPTSVLGHSKRTAERLTAWAARNSGRRYLSVRFGNVIGSRGSMLPVFTRLIESGGPLTVTHPDVTRYFMTIPEACHLVLQAGAIGTGGEVLILDMGSPVRILDIAQRMIDMSGRDIAIVFTGLREGEKLHEELVGLGEQDRRPIHPKISHTAVPPIEPRTLDATSWLAEVTPAHDEPRLLQTHDGAQNA